MFDSVVWCGVVWCGVALQILEMQAAEGIFLFGGHLGFGFGSLVCLTREVE